jgi:hypothetical protein
MTDDEQPPDDQRLEDPPPGADDGARKRGRSPGRLQLRGRYPYYVDLPEIDIVWEGCSPSMGTFAKILMVLATIPSNVIRRPDPESHQR